MYQTMKKIMILSLIVSLLVCIADKSVYVASASSLEKKMISVSDIIAKRMKVKNNIVTKDKEAKQAYAKELIRLSKDTDYGVWEFALIDLNEDGVSEMVITHDSGYHLTIDAYVNGKVESVGGGFSGDQKYYPNKKLYYSTTFHDSVYIEYYRFNGKKMVKLASIEGNIMGEDTYTYYIGKKKVSKRKWKEYEKTLKKGAKESKLKWYKNTSKNRKLLDASVKNTEDKTTSKVSINKAIDMALKYYKAGQWEKAVTYVKKMPLKADRTCIKNLSVKEKKAYKATVKEYQKKYEKESDYGWHDYLHGYYLADIDGDKKAELLIHHGIVPLESVLTVFKYKNGKAKKVAEINFSGHTRCYAYPGHIGIIYRFGFNATEEIGSLSLKEGKLKEKSYNHRILGEDGYDGWFPLRQPLDNHIRFKETAEYEYKYWISWKDLES